MMHNLDLCNISAKAQNHLFDERTDPKYITATVRVEDKVCPLREIPRRFRLLLDLSESEETEIKNAAFALSSNRSYKDIMMKVTNTLSSVILSFNIMRKFQNILEKFSYESTQRLYLHPRTVFWILGTLNNVEELHLKVPLCVLDWCDEKIFFEKGFCDELSNFHVDGEFVEDFYEGHFHNRHHDMSSSTSRDTIYEAATKEKLWSFEDDLQMLKDETAAIYRNWITMNELNKFKTFGDPIPEIRFTNLRTLTFSNNCLDLEWLNWEVMAPNVENVFVPLFINGAGRFLDLILARGPALHSLGIVLNNCTKLFLEPMSLLGYSRMRSFIFVQFHRSSRAVRELSKKILRTMINLEKVYFAYWIEPEVLICTGTYCRELTSVTLNAHGTPRLHEHVFPVLSNMPKLKHLRLERMIVNTRMIYFCRPFNNLEELELMSVGVDIPRKFFKHLASCMPSLTKLTLAPISDFDRIRVLPVLPHVARYMQGIKVLTIGDRGEAPANISDILCVRTMPCLKVLRLDFNSVTFNSNENTILPECICCPNVRKLLLHTKKFEAYGNHVPFTSTVLVMTIVKQMFTGLKVLQLLETNTYTANDRKWLARFFHPVALRYKNCKLVDSTINDYLRNFENFR